MKTPTFSGSCADLTLDGLSSSDPTGRLNAMWRVSSENKEIDLYLRYLHCACLGQLCSYTDTYETNCLGANFDTMCQSYKDVAGLKVVIPRSLLTDGEQLQFQLFVTNILGLQSQSDVINVTVTEKPELRVKMLTPTLTVKRRQLVEIKLSVHLPECGYHNAPIPRLDYAWAWSNAEASEIEPSAGHSQTGMVPRKTSLFIMPYTLGFNTNTTYDFNATVTDKSGNYQGATVYSKVTVVQEPLRLTISGDGAQIYFRNNISLSATAQDPMASEDDDQGMFLWKCFQILEDGTKVQSFDVSGFKDIGILLVPPTHQGFPIGTFEFHLKWSKQFRETQASVIVHIGNNATAQIRVVRPVNALLVQQRLWIKKSQVLHLEAQNAPVNSTVTWSVYTPDKPSNLFLEDVKDNVFTENNSSNLVLRASLFQEGIDYTIQLEGTAAEELPTSRTYLTVSVPVSPKGGSLSVEPCNTGGQAFFTDFHISARDWMLIGREEADLQLEYYFGYTLGGVSVYLSAAYSTSNEVVPHARLFLHLLAASYSSFSSPMFRKISRSQQSCPRELPRFGCGFGLRREGRRAPRSRVQCSPARTATTADSRSARSTTRRRRTCSSSPPRCRPSPGSSPTAR